MDVSLDEIIKKNKIGVRNTWRNSRESGRNNAAASMKRKTNVPKKGAGAPGPAMKKTNIQDLRMLIDSKPKFIRDARDKLIGKNKLRMDARERLTRNKRVAEMLSRGSRRKYDVLPSFAIENRARKTAYMDLEESRLKRRSAGSLLFRTIENNEPVQEILDIESWQEPSIQDITRYQSITRTFSQDDWPHHPTSSHLAARRSNGLKGRLEPNRVHHDEGYRIVVSNLQPTVTHEDIKELFEDIGSLYSSRVVRPGTAEVIYKTMEDAVKAVDTYHNRQLDGQPMKCLLVKPSHMNVSSVSNTKLSSKGTIVPDIYAIHKALFNK